MKCAQAHVWMRPCLIAAEKGKVGYWCHRWDACMYYLDRAQIPEADLEVFDQWCRGRLCVWPPLQDYEPE